jgi:exonuclease III
VILFILLAVDVATNPGPFSGHDGQVKSLVLNARSLKSFHRDEQSNLIVCNLQRFQDLDYNENSDVICMNETWLNSTVSDQEILHPGFSIFRKVRKERSGGGVLIAVKTDSFKTIKEFSPDGEDLQELEIVSTEFRTVTNKKILYCCCYLPPGDDQCWMDRFKTYLQTICDLYENIIIAGDFNLPNIHWDTMENTTGVNELVFVRLLNDHYLS